MAANPRRRTSRGRAVTPLEPGSSLLYSVALPIYEYKCKKGHTFEVVQRMADDSLDKCTKCGAEVKRVFHPPAVHFKGSGFYNTDYGKARGGGSADPDSKNGKGKSESDSKKESKPESSKSGDTKKEGSSKADLKPSGAKSSD